MAIFILGPLGGISAALAATRMRADERAADAWQLGCYTRPWAAHDYRVALDGIAAAGFRYAGLMTAKSKNNLILSVDSTPDEAAAVGAEVARRGLKVISLWGGNFPLDKADGLTPGEREVTVRVVAPADAAGVRASLDDGPARGAVRGADGVWSVALPVADLAVGAHTVRVVHGAIADVVSELGGPEREAISRRAARLFQSYKIRPG